MQPVRILVALSVAISLFMAAGAAGESTPKPLFSEVGSPEAANLAAEGEEQIRSRLVTVDHKRLRKKRILLNLFDDTQVIGVRGRDVRKSLDRHVWVGQIPGIADSEIILSVKKKKVAGTVRTGAQLFKIRPVGNGRHIVIEVRSSPPLREDEPIVPDQSAGDEAASAGGAGVSQSLADDGTVIDVLVVYTPAAKSRNGGVDGIEALIDLAITETNQAYLNSGIHTRLNLVHTAEVAYSESSSMSTDLARLRATSDGYMDEVHALRDLYGADVTSLIEANGEYCGIAYVMRTLSSGFAGYAFSVAHWTCATGYYSFGHELGHNQGSAHDRGNASVDGLFPFSYGYQDPSADFRSVMAYNCPGGCARVQHFSNPLIEYNGEPTGDDGAGWGADNARSINEASATVSNWRQSVAASPPSDPFDLSARAFSSSQINLVWIDAASNETGFKLERSADMNTWSEIATIGVDAQSYADTGLPFSTTYYYRVRAYNGAGNSAYSNMASAMTDSLPLPGQAGTPAPQYGAVNVELDPQLSWEAGTDAQSHDVYFGSSSGALVLQGNQSDVSFEPGVLSAATTYYWRVDSVNSTGPTEGALWRFTTQDPLPADVITVQEAKYRADRDELKIKATSTQQPDVELMVVGFGQMPFKRDRFELKIKPLAPLSAPYEVTITSSYGAQITVPVVGAPPPPTPAAAHNPNPADGTRDVAAAITLGWTAGADTDTHEVYIGIVSGDLDFEGSRSTESFAPGPLQNATRYFWRIDEVNAFGTTAGSEWSFTTVAKPSPPGAAGNPLPAIGENQVSPDVTLSWSAGTQARTHNVYFGTDNSPPLISSAHVGTTYALPTLAYDTTYYWQIEEINDMGSNRGPLWHFTTRTASPADVIVITKAEWRTSKKELKVEATSSRYPDAMLTVVGGLGAMARDGRKNKYRFAEKPLANPGQVTVTSDQGGSATLTVKVR